MADRQLSSWKEIAAHLGVSVRTAQRWEAAEGLPVRRHLHSRLSSVYADCDELTRWWEGRPATKPLPSIAVLPFANLDRDQETEILADGLAEDLITALSQIPELRVVTRSSSFWFKGQTIDPCELGTRLGVRHVLDGSVRRSGSRLRVTAQLVDTVSGCHLWAERFDRELDDPFDIQDQLAEAIARSLSVRLVRNLPAARRTPDPETYNAFLRGRFFWNQRTPESLRRGIAYFEEAISRDPNFALGYAGLADCHTFRWVFANAPWEETLSAAEAAASRALELDPLLPEAHTSFGVICIGRMDIPGAEAAFRRALELNAGEHRARHWHGMTLATLGRYEEALAEVERALELDPFGMTLNQDTGRILLGLGRYEDAIRRLRHTLEIAPQAPVARLYLALALVRAGHLDDALAAAAEDRVLAAFVRTHMGNPHEARAILDESGQGSPTPSHAKRAILHIGLGDESAAVRLFRRGLDERQPDALDLHRGMIPFIRDSRLREEVGSWLSKPGATPRAE